ncbi:MAG: alpha-ketoacid dehydrogenase subunit beta, partial [Thermodesulfobacteriota bacterium]|nr:alpha-ketoacid dehydrogenase subunit beta [Thermodesulfobacteriota bacterium]
MPRLNMVEAINLALREEMERDKRVVVLGEDVGREGGVFRVTDGLQERFGDDRIVDTPLAESGIVGTAMGMALYGLRPIAEIQFDGFLYPCLDQITNHIGRIRNRSRGRFTCPLVIRVPYGGGIHAPEHHSESPEAILAHTPGIKVVIPSTPYEAKGLLLSSIRDPDPVIFLEPKRIYRAIREEVQEGDFTIPLGKARLVQEGRDVTIIAWGAMVREVLNAAEELKGDKIDMEIIDLRTISPMDVDAIITSIR